MCSSHHFPDHEHELNMNNKTNACTIARPRPLMKAHTHTSSSPNPSEMNRPTSCHFARAHTHAYTYMRTHAHPNMRKARTKRNPPVCLSPSELVDFTLLRTESKHVHMRTNISCSQEDESALSVSALEPDRRGRTPHPMLPYSHTNVCVNPIPSHSITSLLTTDTMST